MGNICFETALRLYEICQGETAEADPEETVQEMAAAVHEAMFSAGYCSARCESTECQQGNGGHDT